MASVSRPRDTQSQSVPEPTSIPATTLSQSQTEPQPPQSQPPSSPSKHHHLRMRPRTTTDDIFRRRFVPSSSSSSSNTNTNTTDTHDPEDAVSRLQSVLLTPLYLLSYLFSMLYIARKNDAKRKSLGSSPAAPMHVASARIQDENTGTWSESTSSTTHASGQDRAGGGGGAKGWFVSKKHRKVVGMEMSEAEEVRGVMMLGIVGVLCVGGVIGLYSFWHLGRRWLGS